MHKIYGKDVDVTPVKGMVWLEFEPGKNKNKFEFFKIFQQLTVILISGND